MGAMMTMSILILITCFMLMANRKAASYVRTFRIQAFLVAITASLMVFGNVSYREKLNIVLICLIIIALKVIYIPRLLSKTCLGTTSSTSKDTFYVISYLEIACVGIVIFCNVVLPHAFQSVEARSGVEMANFISVIFIGLLFMISRKKAIGQIVGFLVIENGLFLTAIYATQGMPMVVDIGIFIDLITAVLIMGMLVFRIDREFETTDTNKLKNLRG